MDHLIGFLIFIVLWPYEQWKRSTENSRIGVSPDEEKTLHFWKWFGTIATIIILIICAIVYIAF